MSLGQSEGLQNAAASVRIADPPPQLCIGHISRRPYGGLVVERGQFVILSVSPALETGGLLLPAFNPVFQYHSHLFLDFLSFKTFKLFMGPNHGIGDYLFEQIRYLYQLQRWIPILRANRLLRASGTVLVPFYTSLQYLFAPASWLQSKYGLCNDL
jgi:hypothetical protein